MASSVVKGLVSGGEKFASGAKNVDHFFRSLSFVGGKRITCCNRFRIDSAVALIAIRRDAGEDAEQWKNGLGNLNQQPRTHHIGRTYAKNIPTLQFVE
jgi:hypothetical protein